MERSTAGSRTMFRPLALLLAVVLVAAVAAPASGQASQEYRIRGSDIAVYNLAGEVEIVRGSGADVVVGVTSGGRDAGQLRIETGEVRGRQTLRVIYPSEEIVYPAMGRSSRTGIQVRADGTWGGEGGRGNQVRISGSGSGLEAWADLRIQVPAGQRLALYLAAGTSEVEGVEGDLRVDTGSGEVTATRVRGSLYVDTGSGNVQVSEVSGEVTIDTGSGSVSVSDMQGPSLSVDTGSGSVSGSGLQVESLEVDTGSGSVELTGIASPSVLVDTGSGSVELELLADVEELEVDTGSGGVTLRVPPDLGAQIEVDTGSGGIDMDIPVEIQTARRTYLRGVIGDGGGSIIIDTGSGGVRITQR